MSDSLPERLLLAFSSDLVLRRISRDAATLAISLASTVTSTRCLRCDTPSVHHWSSHSRTLADLPCAGQPVRIN
jgi:hypothetical protein